MDRIDRNILNYLQRDASISNNDLANNVGLAPSSCLRRVRNLKAKGIIKKTIVVTDAKQLGRGIKAIVTIKLADHGAKARQTWIKELKNEAAVSQIYAVSGDIDIVIIMTVGSMEEFQGLGKKLFGGNKNVLQYVSQFVLEEHKFDITN